METTNKELQHTPGIWTEFQEFKPDGKGDFWVKADGKTLLIIRNDFPNAKANARLIASAPRNLQELRDTYLRLQILVQSHLNKGSVLMAFETDSIRASLRNQIAAATGEDVQTLQESIEAEAYDRVKNG